jgi:hypothetical protein
VPLVFAGTTRVNMQLPFDTLPPPDAILVPEEL